MIKTFIMLQKISISDKCCSSELYSSKKPEEIILSCFQHNNNNNNNKMFFLSSKSAYQNDFWRSCDTEDWSNDAENTAAHHRNKLQFNTYSDTMLKIKNISQYFCFCCTLDQINAGLVSRKDFFKNIKNLTVQKLLTGSVYHTLPCYSVFSDAEHLSIFM